MNKSKLIQVNFIILIFTQLISLSLGAQNELFGKGSLEHNGSSFQGKKYGKWIVRIGNGKIYQVQFYKNDIRDSVWITFCWDGKIRNKIRYKNNIAFEWNYYSNDSLIIWLTAIDGLNDSLVESIRLLQDSHQFWLEVKSEALRQADEKRLDYNYHFYDLPVWVDEIRSNIAKSVNLYSSSLYYKEWNEYQQLKTEIEYDSGVEKSRTEYLYDKKGLSKKTYYHNGEIIKIEKVKEDQVVKTIDKS